MSDHSEIRTAVAMTLKPRLRTYILGHVARENDAAIGLYLDVLKAFRQENDKAWERVREKTKGLSVNEMEVLVMGGMMDAVRDVYSSLKVFVTPDILATSLNEFIDEFPVATFFGDGALPC